MWHSKITLQRNPTWYVEKCSYLKYVTFYKAYYILWKTKNERCSLYNTFQAFFFLFDQAVPFVLVLYMLCNVHVKYGGDVRQFSDILAATFWREFATSAGRHIEYIPPGHWRNYIQEAMEEMAKHRLWILPNSKRIHPFGEIEIRIIIWLCVYISWWKLKGTQDWEFLWLRFWNLRYFFVS